MAKLRIKLVLNEGGDGIPLSQLASISEEAEKFIRYLAADAGMQVTTADLIARDFENRSVRFNIEDNGDHQIDEIKGFNTRMAFVAQYKQSEAQRTGPFVRHQTMLQYVKVADALAGHEKLTFGVFHPNDDKPYEYRELTKSSAASMKASLTESVVYKGTLQGTIATISVTEGWFHFRPPGDGERQIRCTYRDDQYSDLIQAARTRRGLVYVRGEICARRFDREVQSVKVVRMKAAPYLSDERYRSFFGADADYTKGLSTDEFIEASRGYEQQ